ncbi:MAG: TldD/PmbA family protein [Bacteroidales bacterium]|nr:TldD/PmbA family protein [Bacteroidales bacterium]
MISIEDKALLRWCIEKILSQGADAARVTLNRSVEELVATLDGEVDKVTRCEDSSLSLEVFVEGKFGSFSTNRTQRESLERFIRKAVAMARTMEPDPLRHLPERGRKAADALTGLEAGLYDTAQEDVTPAQRVENALKAAAWGRYGAAEGMTVLSEEGEYSDSCNDNLVMDSEGLECCHTETSFDYGVEITVADAGGRKYSGYAWDSSSRRDGLDAAACGRRALERACARKDSAALPGGKYTMVVDSEVAGKLVTPLLSALSGYSLQQGNSFLDGSLGQQVFAEGMTLVDLPREKGLQGAKYFDSEGVATRNLPIIENGKVKLYFLNTYMAGKMGMEPTIEGATKVKMMPWPQSGPEQARDRAALLRRCRSGILVTDFNGGNCNPATGDFSYGIEGFLFEDGELVRPVDGMLITGNMKTLWQHFFAAADDARRCLSKLIPTLAFSSVDFSGE